MKKTKKIVALFLAAVMLVCTTVAATVAYLTAVTGEVENTFTVGSVAIDLLEADVNEYGELLDTNGNVYVEGATLADRVKANEYKLIPNHEYVKDPVVTVEEKSEQSFVFIKLKNELIDIIDGTTIEEQILENGWVVLEGESGVYYYPTAVDARDAAVDLSVFESFKLKADADVASYADEDGKVDAVITIDAYAVQADGFEDLNSNGSAADEAWDAASVIDWE